MEAGGRARRARNALLIALACAAMPLAPVPAAAQALPGYASPDVYSAERCQYVGSYHYCYLPSGIDTAGEAANNAILSSQAVDESGGAANPEEAALAAEPAEPAPSEPPAADPPVGEVAEAEEPRPREAEDVGPVEADPETVSTASVPGTGMLWLWAGGAVVALVAGGLLTRRVIG